MSRPRQLLSAAYAAIAVLALFATWSQNVAYFGRGAGAIGSFLADAYANPASSSLTIDLLLLMVPLLAWMVIEGRRLGVRFVWLYFVFGCLVAISVTFPLFLIARERRLAALGEGGPLGISVADRAALAGIGVAVAALAVWTIAR